MIAKFMEGKQPHELDTSELCAFEGAFYACCPGPGKLLANLGGHSVSFEDDFTDFTVSPSIRVSDGRIEWHGFIENGIWLDENKRPI